MTQEDFIKLATEWNNIYLTWDAWTWKTYILNKFKELNKDKKIISVAPTWIAAINCLWSTIHSAFKLYWDNYHVFKKQDINWSHIDILIIDEISMVSCDLFDYMSDVIKKHTFRSENFWWLQVICVWDLAQLPPIFNNKNETTAARYKELMRTRWWVTFNFAKSYQWFIEVNLTEPQRSKDPLLNSLLNRLRNWDMSALNEFKSEWYSTHFANKATHIFPYNYQVDNYNMERLRKIPWKQYKFNWFVQWDFNLNNVLAPQELIIKEGATVMCIKNLECWLVNWDICEVTWITKKVIEVKCERIDATFDLSLETWENIHYDQEWNKEVLWKFKQFPLRLAYWLTSHKSQWLSIDKIIFHYNNSLSKELVYVACSRVTSYDWIYIVK